jgi:hypothetical protein
MLCCQVNAALEELVSHAVLCHKQMGLVSRNQLNRVAAEERQRLHDLYHGVEVGDPLATAVSHLLVWYAGMLCLLHSRQLPLVDSLILP